MKKTFLTAVMAVAVLVCTAQVQFGLFGGPQVTSSKYIVNGKKQPNTQKYGFQLGGSLKVPFDNKLYFSPAMFYSLKGYKVKFNRSDRKTIDQKMGFSFTKYGRYAASFITQFGYETKDGLLLFAQYSHGIGSMNNADGGPGIWHRVMGISIGKYFNKIK